MKRCPKCYSSFADTEQFCELDGTTLVADYSDSNPNQSAAREQWDRQVGNSAVLGTGGYQTSPEERLRQNWKVLTIAAVAAVAAGIVLFVVYQRMSREIPGQSSEQTGSNGVGAQEQVPLLPFRPSPPTTPSPSPEPSASPSEMPSPVVKTETARVALSSSPVSTGGDEKTKRGQVTIQLKNGTSVEADDVWETREGIWYRRRGVVTLLEREQVKAIERASEKTSPTPGSASTPSSSPKASP
jgi:hypothetical protein